MKIAICFSGQIRTWDQCFETWFKLIDELKRNPKFDGCNNEVDIFMHTWNFNTIPPHQWPVIDGVRTEMNNVYNNVSQDEIDALVSIMEPKKIIIEDFNKSSSREKFLFDQSQRIGNDKCGVIFWGGSQLYSLMRAGQLKRDYEIENGFEYDICIKMRYDGRFLPYDLDLLISEIPISIEPQTIYSMHSANINEFPYELIGDIFFYSDSQTYDVLSSFYSWLPTYDYGSFPTNVRIEGVFSYHARSFNIKNIRSSLNIELSRS